MRSREIVTTRQKQDLKLIPSDSKIHTCMIYRRKYEMHIHYLTSAVTKLCRKTKITFTNELVVEFGRLVSEPYLQIYRSGVALLDR